MALGNLWNYYRDEVNHDANENNPAGNYKTNNNKKATSELFECNRKIIASTPENNSRLDTKIVVLLKHLSNFFEISEFAFG